MILFYKLDLLQQVPEKKQFFRLNHSSLTELSRVDITLYYLKKAYGDISESLATTLMLNGFISFETCVNETFEYLKMTETHSMV